MKRLIALLLTLVLLAACEPARSVTAPALTNTSAPTDTPAPTASPTNTIAPTPVADSLYVDPGTDLGPISPYLYGSNYSMFGAVPVASQQAALDSHVTALRF